MAKKSQSLEHRGPTDANFALLAMHVLPGQLDNNTVDNVRLWNTYCSIRA